LKFIDLRVGHKGVEEVSDIFLLFFGWAILDDVRIQGEKWTNGLLCFVTRGESESQANSEGKKSPPEYRD
jgi:hypothetical protein